MPEVSVVVPVYNVEKYLKKCLDSLLNQTLKDIEIILIDDGSTDGSGKICDEYATKDKRIKVIHQTNKGLSGARHIGFSLVKGKYISTIDSDDFIALDYLEKLYQMAKCYHLDIVASQIKSYHNGNISDLTNFGSNIFLSKLEDKLKYLKNDLPYFWTSVVNKIFSCSVINCLNNYPNPQNLNVGEDCLMMIKAAFLSNKMGGVEDACYYYRKNTESLTHSDVEQQSYHKDMAMKEIVLFMNEQKFSKNCMDVVFLNCLYHKLCTKENLSVYLRQSIYKNEYKHHAYYSLKLFWLKSCYKLSIGKKRSERKKVYQKFKEKKQIYVF